MIENEREFRQIHSAIREVKSLFKKRLKHPQGEISVKQAEEKLNASTNLIDFETIEFPEKELGELFEDFCTVLKGSSFQEAAEAQTLKAAVQAGEMSLASLVRKVFRGDFDFLNSVGERFSVSFALLTYLGTNLGSPFLELYAERLRRKVDLSGWLKGSCPLCGSQAAFAKLRREDGKRMLWCQFCGTEWEYLRIKCPFCSTENHKSLKYLFTEETSPYRVYLCDECERYLKAIDERKVPESEEPDLSFENLKTTYLDFLAQKDGYRDSDSW